MISDTHRFVAGNMMMQCHATSSVSVYVHERLPLILRLASHNNYKGTASKPSNITTR